MFAHDGPWVDARTDTGSEPTDARQGSYWLSANQTTYAQTDLGAHMVGDYVQHWRSKRRGQVISTTEKRNRITIKFDEITNTSEIRLPANTWGSVNTWGSANSEIWLPANT